MIAVRPEAALLGQRLGLAGRIVLYLDAQPCGGASDATSAPRTAQGIAIALEEPLSSTYATLSELTRRGIVHRGGAVHKIRSPSRTYAVTDAGRRLASALRQLGVAP